MPNWCAGNIRLRGKNDSIIQFLENEIEYSGLGHEDYVSGPIETIVRDYDVAVRIPEDMQNLLFSQFYIKGTLRNFIDAKQFKVFFGDYESSTVCIDRFKAAWNVEAAPYLEKARRYGIDIRILAFNSADHFVRNIEIVYGEIVENSGNGFDDWYWECPMPTMGG